MSGSLDVIFFALGVIVLATALVPAWRYTPRLERPGLGQRWRFMVLAIVVFVIGYLGALGLALAQKLDPLASLTSFIFLIGAIYVRFTVLLTRSMTTALLETAQSQEDLVRQRTRQLEDMNRKLRASEKEARETSRTKSDFLASMSHEIRTPLTAILGYTDLLLRSEPSAEERKKGIQVIRRNGQHLLELINDVLDISKIEAGEMTIERVDCSPWQLVREVRSLLKSQAAAKDLELHVAIDGPIPDVITSDPVRLRQVLLNLTGNAIKFTESGSVRMVVHMEDATARLAFDVIDTGIGMSREQQENVFLPFRQASASTARQFGGTGLGLAISRRLAGMLDGNIEVESTLGEGSTFTLTVDPGNVEDADLLEGPQSTGTVIEIAQVGKLWNRKLGGRLLLAEDGVDNRRFVAAILQQVGAEVALVENGREAVDRALEAREHGERFDAILMDMQMPVLDGYQAAQELRAAGYDGTIIALTAYTMAGDREKCLAAGCDDFVTKPIDLDRFLASLHQHVKVLPPGMATPTGTPCAAAEKGTGSPPAQDGETSAVLISSLARHPKLADLVKKFAERLPERLGELEEAHRDADLESLQALAHSLRGAGGTYGFAPLTDAAGELESRLREGAPPAEIDAALAHLADVCGRAVAGAE